MSDVGQRQRTAAIFGASGGIGAALCAHLAKQGEWRVHAGSRSGNAHPAGEATAVLPFAFDLDDEASIAAAAEKMRDNPPELVIVATGVLTLPDGSGPERSLRKLDSTVMRRVLELNTIGPAIIAKHILPILPREGRSLVAFLSARVGSISDNALGGWHSYRASKVALNMLIANFAIELGRTHPQAIVAGLHPGTVDTGLSEPFQANLPEGQLLSPGQSASALIRVLDDLTPQDTGHIFDWKGERIPA